LLFATLRTISFKKPAAVKEQAATRRNTPETPTPLKKPGYIQASRTSAAPQNDEDEGIMSPI
jgi:hypothetical protein